LDAYSHSIGSEVDFLEPDPDPKFTAISEHVTPKIPGELFLYFRCRRWPAEIVSMVLRRQQRLRYVLCETFQIVRR
jgi:hypothetical protein